MRKCETKICERQMKEEEIIKKKIQKQNLGEPVPQIHQEISPENHGIADAAMKETTKEVGSIHTKLSNPLYANIYC